MTLPSSPTNEAPSHWNRVLVLGSPGAGKSTVARRLGELLDRPVIHLDREFWRPGWTPTPDREWETRLEELLTCPRFIMDGNYHASLPQRLAVADAAVYLDVPRRTCLWRIFLRRFRHWRTPRADLPEGCPEHFDGEFTVFVWRFRREIHPRVLNLLKQAPPSVDVRILQGRQVRTFPYPDGTRSNW